MLTLAQIIGDDLRTARLRAGLSLEQVAQRTGMHRPIVGRLEAGKHAQSIESLARVARALRMPLVELVGPALDVWEAQASVPMCTCGWTADDHCPIHGLRGAA